MQSAIRNVLIGMTTKPDMKFAAVVLNPTNREMKMVSNGWAPM